VDGSQWAPQLVLRTGVTKITNVTNTCSALSAGRARAQLSDHACLEGHLGARFRPTELPKAFQQSVKVAYQHLTDRT
jgi:hypothetical protein